MGTSPTTERIASLNPVINPEKYEYPCQVGDFNSGGQVSPQGTQPAELRSVRHGFYFHCIEKSISKKSTSNELYNIEKVFEIQC